MDRELEIQAYIEGTLDEAGRERLEERLKRDPAALAEVVDQLQVHNRLGAVLGEGRPLAEAVVRELRLLPDSQRFSREVVDRLKRRAARWRIWSVGAACAFFAIVLGFLLVPELGWFAAPAGPPALLVVGDRPDGGGDAAVRARLERLGFAVTLRHAKDLTPDDPRGKAVVLVSSTSRATDGFDVSAHLVRALRDSEVPLLVWEPILFHRLGMIPRGENKTDWAADRGLWDVVIADPSHPLAAGLEGRVRVAEGPDQLSWGRPRGDAAKVAHLEGNPSQAAIFAYDRGATMPGRTAPARRVGFFLFDETAARLTRDGWKLFDAAVRWCQEDRP